jgi:hypothetical protein
MLYYKMNKCDICNYCTDDNSNFTKHLQSKKHLSNVNGDTLSLLEEKKEKVRLKQMAEERKAKEQELKLQALQFKQLADERKEKEREYKLKSLQFKQEQAVLKQKEKEEKEQRRIEKEMQKKKELETKEAKKKEKEKAKEIEVIPFHHLYYNEIKSMIDFDFEGQLHKTTNGIINLLKEILKYPQLKSVRIGQGNILQFYNNVWIDGSFNQYGDDGTDEDIIKIDMECVLLKMIDIMNDYFIEKQMTNIGWVSTCLSRLTYNRAVTKATMRRIIDSFTSFNTKEALERIDQDLKERAEEEDEQVKIRREEQENKERQIQTERDKIIERQRREQEAEDARFDLEARTVDREERRALYKEVKAERRRQKRQSQKSKTEIETDTDTESESEEENKIEFV